MGRIEADAYPFLFINPADNSCQLLKSIANLRTLPSSILQEKSDGILNPSKGLIDPLKNSLNRLVFQRFHPMADMNDEVLGSDMLCSLKVNDDRSDRSFIEF